MSKKTFDFSEALRKFKEKEVRISQYPIYVSITDKMYNKARERSKLSYILLTRYKDIYNPSPIDILAARLYKERK